MKIIAAHHVAYADNIRHPDLWIAYPFFTALIKKLYPLRETSILDWGGLYGHVTVLLRKAGFENVHNYLLHYPPPYDLFRESFQIETLLGKDPNHIDVASASYDIVISSGVLEHVREDGIGDDTLILKDIHRVLKPGGTLWIWYLPSKYSASEAVNRLTGRWHHTFLYTRQKITSLLEKNGFQTLFLARHGFLPGALKRLISPPISPATLFKMDYTLANLPILRAIAANFFIIAGKVGSDGRITPPLEKAS
ncbi:MAG: hypothetical protein DSY91_02865 [Deltaproteobacteria bacterium]|nr:MAG: hypothetical protein DSY91_02865 [Deltaproteobacteria bacterium]